MIEVWSRSFLWSCQHVTETGEVSEICQEKWWVQAAKELKKTMESGNAQALKEAIDVAKSHKVSHEAGKWQWERNTLAEVLCTLYYSTGWCSCLQDIMEAMDKYFVLASEMCTTPCWSSIARLFFWLSGFVHSATSLTESLRNCENLPKAENTIKVAALLGLEETDSVQHIWRFVMRQSNVHCRQGTQIDAW